MFRKKSWEEVHEIGKVKFVLFYGVLFWATLTVILAYLWEFFRGNLTIDSIQSIVFLKKFLFKYFVFAIAGVFWGLIMWNYHLAQVPLKKIIENEENTKTTK